MRERSELFANTIAAWTWSQGTLIASVVSLPLLTRWLSPDEFGLWTQLLSLSALATVADMGMSLVFLRRITDSADTDSTPMLRSAAAFYRASTAVLTAVLVLACTLPHGLLSPYTAHTNMPLPAAFAVIAGIAVNLRCQPSALRLLARGRMDLNQIFGAGPAMVGTFATVLAAYCFGTAVAVAFAYAAVEIAFDVALVITARQYAPTSRTQAPVTSHTFVWWVRVWYESTGVLMIDIVPTISMLICITVVSHVVGLEAAAVYGVAGKVGSLVRRFIMPFTESLYVSLCRATASARGAVMVLLVRLAIVALATGITVVFMIVAAGPSGMRIAFGSAYGSSVWVVLVMIFVDTIRSIYRPFLRKIQSENDIGSLRFWFVASIIAQVPLAILASARWSTVGAAIAILACTFLFEAVPTAWKLWPGHQLLGAASKPVIGQVLAALGTACFALLLAWERPQMGTIAVSFAAIGAVTTGLFDLNQVLKYLAAARSVRNSWQMPNPGEENDRPILAAAGGLRPHACRNNKNQPPLSAVRQRVRIPKGRYVHLNRQS
jgi:O-antigen/teichoic acid export membrane protein